MATLHLGTFDFPALKALLPGAERCLGVAGSPSQWRFTNGDGWEEWGEGLGDTGHPEHIVMEGDSVALMQDVAYVLTENASVLQPMTYPNQAGTLAVITHVDERGDAPELFVVVDGAARDFIRDLTHKEPDTDPNTLWEHSAWLERQGRGIPSSMLDTTTTGPGTLSELMDFDRIIRVRNGHVITPSSGPWAPSAYLEDGALVFTDSYGEWEAVDGFSGQQGYAGPVMHSSEQIAGGIARHILENDGDYVALVVTVMPDGDSHDFDDVAGWCVARLKEQA